jgi:CheY-like chemotaxis protein/HD-like signal output (HDOD) protein
MANILYLDESAVAGIAIKGILARVNHRCVVVSTIEEAWKALRELVRIDLIILELRLKNENGMTFIQQLRSECTFKDIPIVVYSNNSDHGVVQKALSFNIQSYLTKPFNDEAIYREVKKAVAYPWRNLQFEEEKSFCAQMGFDPETLKKMREELILEVDRSLPSFEKFAERRDLQEVAKAIASLSDSAETVGVWAVANYLQELRTKAEEGNWTAFQKAGEGLDFTRRMLFCHLNPSYVPDGFFSEDEKREREEAAQRGVWMAADEQNQLPCAKAAEAEVLLERITVCPVVESVAASFQLMADGKVSSLGPIMDLVSKDPGLSVQMLIAANALPREEKTIVEDPRLAVSLLGEIRLSALAKTFPQIAERRMEFGAFSWSQFWMSQVGVGRLAKFACDYMEFRDIDAISYTAGLIHDFGKLLLVRAYPFALEAAYNCSKKRGISLAEAEKRFVGMSSAEMAYHFAIKNGLPPAYANVVRWAEKPEEAPDNTELVAVVSMARLLCLRNRVGVWGDTPEGSVPLIEETSAWEILQRRVFPSFNLKKFEVEARGVCLNLKQELLGRERWYRTSDGN